MAYRLAPIEPEELELRDVFSEEPGPEELIFLQLRPGAAPPGKFDYLTRRAAERLRDLLGERLAPAKTDP